MRNRNNRVEIYLNNEELLSLTNKVQKSGISREKYLRKVISESKVYELPDVDFFNLVKETNRIGSNIEQILRVANSKHFIDAPRLRKDLDELENLEQLMWDTFMPKK